jgi:hypothetical protein
MGWRCKETKRKISLTFGATFGWDVQRSLLDITKLQEVTGWRSQVPIEEGDSHSAMKGVD